MVELGSAHDEEHAKIGALAASHVDVLLPVLPARISTLIGAYAAGNPQGTVIPCPSFVEAQSWLTANLGPQDVVLIENDLPDLYEKALNL
jgi:UDP-N-acetylmuramoyl-tripeptide--D-alanyl-D-alanine ligase